MKFENFKFEVFVRRFSSKVGNFEDQANVANPSQIGENANCRFGKYNLFGRCLRFSKN